MYGDILEILPNLHMIDGINANAYMVLGNQIILIDTGMPGNQEKIFDYLQNVLKSKPEDIKTILITHHHVDHTGSLYELKKITNADVAVFKDEADYVSGKKPASGPFYMRIGNRLMSLFTSYRTVEPEIILNEDDVVEGYRVIHTPGHTPGSISLYNPENRVIIVGDTLIFNGEKVNGPPSMLIDDQEALKKSVEKISKLDCEVMLSGHGKPLTKNASELIMEYYKTL
jgi:hydroxyacylglutathione hydrolase